MRSLLRSRISRRVVSSAVPHATISWSARPQPMQTSSSSRQQRLTQGDATSLVGIDAPIAGDDTLGTAQGPCAMHPNSAALC